MVFKKLNSAEVKVSSNHLKPFIVVLVFAKLKQKYCTKLQDINVDINVDIKYMYWYDKKFLVIFVEKFIIKIKAFFIDFYFFNTKI